MNKMKRNKKKKKRQKKGKKIIIKRYKKYSRTLELSVMLVIFLIHM